MPSPRFPDTTGPPAVVGLSGVAASLLSPPISGSLPSPGPLGRPHCCCLLPCLLPQTDFPQGKDCLISQFTFAFVTASQAYVVRQYQLVPW